MSNHNHNFTPAWGQGKRRVAMDGRVFFVGFKPDGTPRNIVERKLRADGKVRSETYWHHTKPTGAFGRGPRVKTKRTVILDVLEAAGVDTRQFAAH